MRNVGKAIKQAKKRTRFDGPMAIGRVEGRNPVGRERYLTSGEE